MKIHKVTTTNPLQDYMAGAIQMSETDWAQFFDLLERITELNLESPEARVAVVEAMAEQYDGTNELREFVSWFGDIYID